MLVRTFVTILYLVAVGIAIVLQFYVPGLAVLLLYALLGWFIISIFVYRLPVMGRTVFGRPGTAAPSAPAVVPSPIRSNPMGTPLSFCAYCATPVEPGTPVCPNCQHPIPAF